MNSPSKSQTLLDNMDWNILHFEQILKNKKTDYYRDAAIQRFCLVFDATQKTLRAFAEEKGETVQTPEECFKFALFENWIDDYFKLILKDYQSLKGGLETALAENIYPRLENHHNFFHKLHAILLNGN